MSEPVDLDRLEELRATATPGPWEARTWNEPTGMTAIFGRGGSIDVSHWKDGSFAATNRSTAAYIVALVNAAPALLDELRLAREVVEAARGFADKVANEDHGDADGVCLGCGQSWPCFVERLHTALAAYRASVSEEAQDG